MRASLAVLLLAGCASLPPTGGDRERVSDFALEARFSLKTERPGEAVQQASGRLSWSHAQDGDRILLASPFGQGLAEITLDAAGARLLTGDGKLHRAADAATLLRDTTGFDLPLGELPAWLLGRAARGGHIERDALGRPAQLRDGGWSIRYDYDDTRPQALPSRLLISRDSELDLRLRIEEWRLP